MGRIILKNQPCISCSSSDAMQIYEDNSAYCFSCNTGFSAKRLGGQIETRPSMPQEYKKDYSHLIKEITDDYPTIGFKERKIYKQVAELYGVKVSYDIDGNVDTHYLPYNFDINNRPQAYKIRVMPKDFTSRGSVGNMKGLFGDHLWKSGKRLIITEGEYDAMAIQSAYYKKYRKFYPVKSLRSATIIKDLIESREEIRNNFEEVVFWPDRDEAGEKCLKEVAKIIGYDKIKIVSTTEKDANDLWIKDEDAVLKAIYDAKLYTPVGILEKDQLWRKLEEYNEIESVPYPEFMSGLNDKLKGMRFGEITLWTSGTGSGKSTLLREIALHLLTTTKDKIGIISLEESPAETARKMSGMAINKNPAKEEIPLLELKVGFDRIFGDDRVMILDHQGSISDGSIMDFLEYMCLNNVKYLFIDHITILASEGADGLSGNEAIDKIMNDLLRLVKKYNVWIGLISHLRKTDGGKSFEDGKLPSMDDIRGSGSIKQISMDIIAFARNVSALNEEDRNTIQTKVLKCRYTGLTGPSGSVFYDYDTGRLTDKRDAMYDL